MNIDFLSQMLRHFGARARTFFTGNLCEHARFPKENSIGYLHLVRSGRANLREPPAEELSLDKPTLVFYTQPITHWLEPDPTVGADLACASISFERHGVSPILQALPSRFQCELADLEEISPIFELLFTEAFASRPGRREILDRLFEIIIIEILRISIASGTHRTSLLRGLGHSGIVRLLDAIHENPAGPWSLPAMAKAAGMSRSNFAEVFRREVGETPGDYLARWRISVAQSMMMDGLALTLAGERVGYVSHAGFVRSFRRVTGTPPREWLRTIKSRLAETA